MKKIVALLLLMTLGIGSLFSQNVLFDGIQNNMGNLFLLSDAKSRSISPENFSGEKGRGGMAKLGEGSASNAARDLGQGWKVNPYIKIAKGETFTLAEIDGSGAINHIWMTPTGTWRFSILRIYWDDEKDPSVECPVGDFFGMGWGEYAPLQSLAICVNPGSAFNCYWQMPFRKKCKITMQNLDEKEMSLYYQIDYCLTEVPKNASYFHAQFHRTNPLKYKDVYTIVDQIKGKGQYVGTYLAWQVNNNGWWGEGEIKFFMDGDKEFPTICGTGTEDYFCGSYNFDRNGKYTEFCTPYSGLHQVIRPDGAYRANQRFGLYRWHITDPIRFEKDLKVTIQALGWTGNGRYLPLQDDIASVAFWYQTEPHQSFSALPSKDELEVR
ncbi:MAG TPA: glycoside hydrolase family 172 protein [Prolixibacteraceae bacterium]|nr:glycoside hydrolase family 172 protein [Prolixibacteraceae bacterium]